MGVTPKETAEGWLANAAEQRSEEGEKASGASKCSANPATGLKKKELLQDTQREEERVLFLIQIGAQFSFFPPSSSMKEDKEEKKEPF